MEVLKQIFELVAYTVITGCGLAIIKKVIDVANVKIDELQEVTELKKYEKLNKYIDDAQNVVATVVTSIAGTFVDSLKKSGNFSKEAQKEAKNQAIEISKSLITEEMKNAITVARGDFDVYLDNLIEQIVREIKVESQDK